MNQESTSFDLVELTRQGFEAGRRGDVDAALSLYAPDAVYLTERLGRFDGLPAIRGYFEDWFGSFDDLAFELQEVLGLGNGVVFSVQVMTGRHRRSGAEVSLRNAAVHTFTDGLIVQSTTFIDIDEARAAAQRVAESRPR